MDVTGKKGKQRKGKERRWGAEFAGGLVVMIQHFHCCNPGSILGLGSEIPHQAIAYLNFYPCSVRKKLSDHRKVSSYHADG